MNGPVEERLRRALAQQAETTTTSPDGWRRIQARRAGARRQWFDWWKLLAPAAIDCRFLLEGDLELIQFLVHAEVAGHGIEPINQFPPVFPFA